MESKAELVRMYEDTKNENIKLLEEKRSLLLQLGDISSLCSYLQSQIHDHELIFKQSNIGPADLMSSTSSKSVEVRCDELERSLQDRTAELIKAKEEIIYLREKMEFVNEQARSCTCGALGNTSLGNRPSIATVDEVEALKHQLVVYQEDFHSEKKDKEKAEAENKLVKAKLREAEDFIHHLKQETVRYERALRGLSNEKDTLKRQVRRLSTSGLPLSPVHRTLAERTFGPSEILTEDDVIARNNPRPNLMRMESRDMCNADVVRG